MGKENVEHDDMLKSTKAKEMELNYQYVWIPQTEMLLVKVQFMKVQCHINQYYIVFYGST